ncbi:MAG: response regulator [Desulfobulbaceae bacterium]|nr:response regulator [Desulfobulbaceae bacterium]
MEFIKKRKRVLIVDDDVALCRSLQIQLNMEGYDVETAFDAASGLSRAFSSLPELIFLDFHLPDESGLEILPEMLLAMPGSRIIIVSGDTAAGMLVRRRYNNMVGYLQKPFELDELLRCADQYAVFQSCSTSS